MDCLRHKFFCCSCVAKLVKFKFMFSIPGGRWKQFRGGYTYSVCKREHEGIHGRRRRLWVQRGCACDVGGGGACLGGGGDCVCMIVATGENEHFIDDVGVVDEVVVVKSSAFANEPVVEE